MGVCAVIERGLVDALPLPAPTFTRITLVLELSTAGDSATGGAKAAASRATEDMHTLIRALKTDLSCMSVRLERLEALLSA